MCLRHRLLDTGRAHGTPAGIVKPENALDLPGRERDLCQRCLDTLADRCEIKVGGLGVASAVRHRRLVQAGGYFHWASHLMTNAKSSLIWLCNGRDRKS